MHTPGASTRGTRIALPPPPSLDHPMTASRRASVLACLARVAGHVASVRRMVEEDRSCIDVLMQIASVQAALARVGGEVLQTHVEHCVADALRSEDEADRKQKLKELVTVFERHAQFRGR